MFNANSVDLDQTLGSAASDLSLHCLPKSLSRYGTLGINESCLSYKLVAKISLSIQGLSLDL